jgi:hypothetical protein
VIVVLLKPVWDFLLLSTLHGALVVNLLAFPSNNLVGDSRYLKVW